MQYALQDESGCVYPVIQKEKVGQADQREERMQQAGEEVWFNIPASGLQSSRPAATLCLSTQGVALWAPSSLKDGFPRSSWSLGYLTTVFFVIKLKNEVHIHLSSKSRPQPYHAVANLTESQNSLSWILILLTFGTELCNGKANPVSKKYAMVDRANNVTEITDL